MWDTTDLDVKSDKVTAAVSRGFISGEIPAL
jgi:hypothetical protein